MAYARGDARQADTLMAYQTDIPQYRCGCGKKATKRVFNRYNALVNQYCATCAKRKVARLSKLEVETPSLMARRIPT